MSQLKLGSLRDQLDALKDVDPAVFEEVDHFLAEVLPSVCARHKWARVDDGLPKHFNVRDNKGKGILGFYPNGKLVCISVGKAIRCYGPWIEEATKNLREKVVGTKILRSKDQGDQIGQALDSFLDSIGRQDLP